MPAESNAIAGRQPVLLRIDGASQASYRLALPMPPCLEGSQPRLELLYRHNQPNGTLGVGWRIDGVSSIQRTGATVALDGYNGAVNHDARDRFTLDRQRLINVDGDYGRPGTIYRPKGERWRHVRAGRTDADGFVAITKDGEIWTYGTTRDSRLLAQGSGKVRVWALDAIEDAQGNRIEYRYVAVPVAGGADCGVHYLERISYRLRDDAEARTVASFTYEERPDPVTVFVGGCGASTLYRLKRVSIWSVADAPARHYDCEYASGVATRQSRLIGVTERGGAAPEAGFRRLVSVDWQDTETPGFDPCPPVALDTHPNTLAVHAMDMSGTGCAGMVQLWLDRSEVLHATTYLAIAGGSFHRGLESVLGAFPPEREILQADFNGDGKADLLVAYRHRQTGHLVLAPFVSNGAGFDALPEHDTGDEYCAGHLGFHAVDVNGDGCADLVEAYAHDDPQRGKLLFFRTYLSLLGRAGPVLFAPAQTSATPDPASPACHYALLPMDVNGDGMTDLVRIWSEGPGCDIHVTAYLGVADPAGRIGYTVRRDTCLKPLHPLGQCLFVPLDINGDGNTDLLRVWEQADEQGPVLHMASLIANGAGGFVAGPHSRFPGRRLDRDGLSPIRFHGGRQTQLLSTWNSDEGERMLSVYAPSPSGLFRLVTDLYAGPASARSGVERLLVGDVNGDGKADLISVGADSAGRTTARSYLSRGPYPDLVHLIRDHQGLVIATDAGCAIRPAPAAPAPVPKEAPWRASFGLDRLGMLSP
jgi:hypothetical protein